VAISSAPHRAQAAGLRRRSAINAICPRPPAHKPAWIFVSSPGSEGGQAPLRARHNSDIQESARFGRKTTASRLDPSPEKLTGIALQVSLMAGLNAVLCSFPVLPAQHLGPFALHALIDREDRMLQAHGSWEARSWVFCKFIQFRRSLPSALLPSLLRFRCSSRYGARWPSLHEQSGIQNR